MSKKLHLAFESMLREIADSSNPYETICDTKNPGMMAFATVLEHYLMANKMFRQYSASREDVTEYDGVYLVSESVAEHEMHVWSWIKSYLKTKEGFDYALYIVNDKNFGFLYEDNLKSTQAETDSLDRCAPELFK